jgi:hypothetical protein
MTSLDDAKLVAYYEKEAATRLDIDGNHISEDILLYEYTRNLEFMLTYLDDPSAWGKYVTATGDEEGNHNELEYTRDHVMPYLIRDLPEKFTPTLKIMAALVAKAARQTNYWGDSERKIPFLYNPYYDEETEALCRQLCTHGEDSWKELAERIVSYIAAHV